MHTFTRSFASRSAAVAALVVGSLLSFAAPAQTAATRSTVHFADLDLSRDAGATVLYRRIAVAASHVCGPTHGRNLREQAQVQLCREQAIARAVAGVPSAAFASWYSQKTGRGTAVATLAANRN